jgi:hypothetical protein
MTCLPSLGRDESSAGRAHRPQWRSGIDHRSRATRFPTLSPQWGSVSMLKRRPRRNVPGERETRRAERGSIGSGRPGGPLSRQHPRHAIPKSPASPQACSPGGSAAYGPRGRSARHAGSGRPMPTTSRAPETVGRHAKNGVCHLPTTYPRLPEGGSMGPKGLRGGELEFSSRGTQRRGSEVSEMWDVFLVYEPA